MLEIPGIFDRAISRRRLLQFGACSAVGSLMNQSVLGAAASSQGKPIQSCILLMLYGGPSHLDSWDMKPRAPIEIRGEYQPIKTSVPGRVVCEHLPYCARLVDKLTVIRSMHHGMSNHNSAMYQALVGRRPKIDLDILGAHRAEDFPCVGSVLSHVTVEGQLPRTANPLVHVALPHVMHNVVDLPGQNAGFLGGRSDPLQVVHDPNRADFHVPDLSLPEGVSDDRLRGRWSLLRAFQTNEGQNGADSLEAYQNRAFDLLHSDAVQHALRIDGVPEKTRERYGRNTLGQSLLLARNLVEAGVRFINVNDKVYNGQDANWDSHEKIFPRHRALLSPFDQGFSALIEDLDQRGQLDTTLVIAMGEFGRTPKVNTNAGRDHWPDCYCAVIAGGGVAQGATYGESDRHGAYPVADRVTPGDLAATIFWRFGINPQHEIYDPLGRPFPLADGQPIKAIFPGVAIV